ncbi:MAG: hypothetical protein AAF928_07735 [Myxococcota bacterium]
MGFADRWAKTVLGLGHHRLRAAFARSELERLQLGVMVEGLDELCRGAETGDEEMRTTLGAFVPSIVDRRDVERVTGLRATANAGTWLAARRLLRGSTYAGFGLDRNQKPVGQVAQKGDGRPMTLGERRALARRPTRQALDALMRDPHPLVVRLLLQNPRITEDDVLRMAAHRPANAAVACEIGMAWSRHGRTRMALTLNPYVPPAVAVPLLGLLNRHELLQVARARDLPAVVRATARELFDLRPPIPTPRSTTRH